MSSTLLMLVPNGTPTSHLSIRWLCEDVLYWNSLELIAWHKIDIYVLKVPTQNTWLIVVVKILQFCACGGCIYFSLSVDVCRMYPSHSTQKKEHNKKTLTIKFKCAPPATHNARPSWFANYCNSISTKPLIAISLRRLRGARVSLKM